MSASEPNRHDVRGGLDTDLYELRMAVSYLRRGMEDRATFSLFSRRLPAGRGFLVAAGLPDVLDFLEGFGFAPEELDWLAATVGLPDDDLAPLARLRFTGDVHAVPEGRVVFADEPLLEVTAPLPEAQLVETALVNLVTFQTSVAAKAARCRLAAPDADLIDFAARRTHGLQAATAVARLSALVGFAGTSFTSAARRYGLTAVGTMAHSYVQAFGDDRAAFRAFAQDFPEATVYLVDTFDTEAGVRAVVDVVAERGDGVASGVRLDSGDLDALARRTRSILDAAGLTDTRIMASGGLDEFALADLTAGGAPIDAYGIGTRMGVSADAPSLDSAYKLVAYAGRPVMKLSAGKQTAPGAKQVLRPTGGGADLLALRDETVPPGHERLLVPVMRDGRRVEDAPAAGVDDARRRFERDLGRLPERARRIRDPEPVAVRRSDELEKLTGRVRAALAAGAVPERA